MSLFQWLLNDRPTLFQFLEDGARLVQGLMSPIERDAVCIKRDIHTLKGNAAIFHLTTVTSLCETLEERLEDGGCEALSDDERVRLADAWKAVERRLRQLGEKNENRIEIAVAEYQAMITAIDRRAPYSSLDGIVRAWVHEPMKQRLHRYGELARALARRLERGDLTVQIQTDAIRLPKGALAPFWSSVIHVIRNAVDHGIEPPDERVRSREERARASSACARRRRIAGWSSRSRTTGAGSAGSSWPKRARAAGLPCETRAELVEAMFSDGVTTRQTASDISGRGVGMAVVRAACVDTGGRYDVWSEPGCGSRFEFSWPLSVIEASADEAAAGLPSSAATARPTTSA